MEESKGAWSHYRVPTRPSRRTRFATTRMLVSAATIQKMKSGFIGLLRELDPNDLWLYAADALFVWGDVADFKHFLPRIFELAAAQGNAFEDPSVVFNKLRHGHWRNWPDVEQRSIEHYLNALWTCVLESQPNESYGEEVEDWLCGIAQAVTRLSPYLQTWIAMETENAQLNFAGFIASTNFSNPKCHANAFWEERAELFDEVAEWVRGDAVKAKMKAIAAEYSHYDFVERAYISLP